MLFTVRGLKKSNKSGPFFEIVDIKIYFGCVPWNRGPLRLKSGLGASTRDLTNFFGTMAATASDNNNNFIIYQSNRPLFNLNLCMICWLKKIDYLVTFPRSMRPHCPRKISMRTVSWPMNASSMGCQIQSAPFYWTTLTVNFNSFGVSEGWLHFVILQKRGQRFAPFYSLSKRVHFNVYYTTTTTKSNKRFFPV